MSVPAIYMSGGRVLMSSGAAVEVPSTGQVNMMGGQLLAGGDGELAYGNTRLFQDAIFEGAGFQTTGGGVVTTNASGWPTADFQLLLNIDSYNSPQPWYYTGSSTNSSTAFACGYISNGSGTETITAVNGGSIANIVRTAAPLVTFDYFAPKAGGYFGVQVTGTTSGVASIWCYLPAYRSAATNQYTDTKMVTNEAIALYGPLAHIRIMWPQLALWDVALHSSATRHTPANTKIYGGKVNGAVQWPTGKTGVTFTSAPVATATSATLTANWGGTTNTNYWLLFSDNETRQVTLTNGSAAVSWTGGLTAVGTLTTSAIVAGGEAYPVEPFVDLANACNSGIGVCMPLIDDATNSWTTAVATMLASRMNTGVPIYIELGNELWNSNYVGSNVFANAVANLGFSGSGAYYATRLHTIAGIFQSAFGSRYGTDLRLVATWQTDGNGIVDGNGGAYNMLAYYVAQGWSVTGDLWSLGMAPYSNPAFTTGMTIAQLDSAFLTTAQVVGFTVLGEHIFVLGSHYGLSKGWVGYEDGLQANSYSSAYTNLWWDGVTLGTGGALMDSGITAPYEAHYQSQFNSGCIAATHFTVGTSAAPSTSPLNDLTNLESAATTSPIYEALLSFIPSQGGGFTPTRNVVSVAPGGGGNIIPGNCYLDNNSGGNPALNTAAFGNAVPYHLQAGPVSWFLNVTAAAAGTFDLKVTISSTSTGTSNVEITGGNILKSGGTAVAIPNNGGTPTVYDFGNVTLGAGPNYILLGVPGTSQGNITVTQLELF